MFSIGLNDGYGESEEERKDIDERNQRNLRLMNEKYQEERLIREQAEEKRKDKEIPLWRTLKAFIRWLEKIEDAASNTFKYLSYLSKIDNYSYETYNKIIKELIKLRELTRLQEEKKKSIVTRVSSLFSSIPSQIKLKERELSSFKEGLTNFFSNFNELYKNLLELEKFIDDQIKKGDDTKYEQFIDETTTIKYNEYNLFEKLHTCLDHLGRVHSLIVSNTNHVYYSLQLKITPPLQILSRRYDGLEEFTKFFKNAKVQIDAYQMSMNKEIPYTDEEPLVGSVQGSNLKQGEKSSDDEQPSESEEQSEDEEQSKDEEPSEYEEPSESEEPSENEEPYYAGGNQSTKKVRMPAKRRRSLLKSTREKNKARRRKSRKPRKPRKSRKSRKMRKTK